MARIIGDPGKPAGQEHPIRDSIVNAEPTRHVVAIALALILVGMIVAALLLSANEGTRADREAAADRAAEAAAAQPR